MDTFVHCHHSESDAILENIRLLKRANGSLAGRSGSVETTISKLLVFIRQLTAGKILIDGYDISSFVRLRSLRQQIARWSIKHIGCPAGTIHE